MNISSLIPFTVSISPTTTDTNHTAQHISQIEPVSPSSSTKNNTQKDSQENLNDLTYSFKHQRSPQKNISEKIKEENETKEKNDAQEKLDNLLFPTTSYDINRDTGDFIFKVENGRFVKEIVQYPLDQFVNVKIYPQHSIDIFV